MTSFFSSSTPPLIPGSSRLSSLEVDLSKLNTIVASATVTADQLVNSSKTSITQITTPTTSVAFGSRSSGVITTVASTLVAQGTETFVVTTTSALTGSVILTSFSYTGAGSPVVKLGAIVDATSFELSVTNYHAADALDAVLVIHFMIV